MAISSFLSVLSHVIWSYPLYLFLFGLGLYFTLRLGFIQLRLLPQGIRETFTPAKGKTGEMSPFQALMTALSATVGTGNIIGVGMAIVLGGPGAIFWLWVSAFLMMTIKYGEALLAVKYRRRGKSGAYYGGPMYYMRYGLKMPKLAAIYSFCGFLASFGVGNMVQANSLALAMENLWQIPPLCSGLILRLLIGTILIGGTKRIAGFSGKMVPLMAGIYIFAGLIFILCQWREIPAVFHLIFKSAIYGIEPVCGGFAGATIISALRLGTTRAVFSNEAGLGNASIAAAAAKTDSASAQGLVSMVGTWIDSFVICTITAFVILISGLWQEVIPDHFNGALLTANALSSIYGNILGNFIVQIGLILFAFSTIIGWAFYGQRYAAYLWGEKAANKYKLAATIVTFCGAIICSENVWVLSDCFNGLMIFPNLIALFLLRKTIIGESRGFKRYGSTR